jgi:hypothetical protein
VTFHIIQRVAGVYSVAASASNTVPLGSWIDLFIEETANIWNIYSSAGFSMTATDTSNTQGTFSGSPRHLILIQDTGAIAGCRVTNGQFFSASDAPITLSNL